MCRRLPSPTDQTVTLQYNNGTDHTVTLRIIYMADVRHIIIIGLYSVGDGMLSI